jgi:hypothetical protein
MNQDYYRGSMAAMTTHLVCLRLSRRKSVEQLEAAEALSLKLFLRGDIHGSLRRCIQRVIQAIDSRARPPYFVRVHA